MLSVVTQTARARDLERSQKSSVLATAGDRVTLGNAEPLPQKPVLVAPSDGPAPAGPGGASSWTTGAKEGVGRAINGNSKVSFTVANGCLTECYYPRADKANVRDLKFIVSDGKTFSVFDIDTFNRVAVVGGDSLTYEYVAENKDHGFKLTKTYVTDPDRNTVMIDVKLESTSGKPLDLYVMYDPSLNNSGMGDSGGSNHGMLVSHDGEVASALASSVGFQEMTTGYAISSDGVSDLLQGHQLNKHYESATDGNILQIGKLLTGSKGAQLTLALGFGGNEAEAQAAAQGSLSDGFEAKSNQYADGWKQWLNSLNLAHIPEQYRAQIKVALMALRAHEDPSNPGAFVASMTIPWGDAQNADKADVGGYHRVWPRDLYQIALAFLAVGDRDSAIRCCDFMWKQQALNPMHDGALPQNTWTDGTSSWTNLQMDQVAFPVVLAWLIDQHKGDKPAYVTNDMYWNHIRKATEYIVKHGPKTQQERWEELEGYSPSTLAAVISGLVCGADIANHQNNGGAAFYYETTADDWNKKLDSWLVANKNGQRYYIRANPTEDPNDGQVIWTANHGGQIRKDDLVDGGFLELVRMGLRKPHDPLIDSSVAKMNQMLRFETPHGSYFYRYNPDKDKYGETPDGEPFTGEGVGRGWPLLSGEVGIYEYLAQGDPFPYMQALVNSSNRGGMFPEQVFDKDNPAGTTEDPRMTVGRAAQVLIRNYNVCRTATGDANAAFISRDALTKIQERSDPSISPQLHAAAGYLLANKDAFDMLDVATQGGDKSKCDGHIAFDDLRTVVSQRPLDLLPLTLQLGAGTGCATPLAWALAVAIRLASLLGGGPNVETPSVVANRYANKAS